MVSLFILKGKRILQELCTQNVKWDEPVSKKALEDREKWKTSVKQLSDVNIDRCFRKNYCKKINHCSIYHFSYASETGYGVVTYTQSVNQQGEIFCNLVMARSRVAPLTFTPIPRLELTTATLTVKLAVQLRKELDVEIHDEVFWTDSKVVLGYIQNTTKKFKTLVANRIHQIKGNSDVLQWHYIPTKENPVDNCSRGLNMKQNSNVKRWFHGPAFFWKPEITWHNEGGQYSINEDDAEVKMTINVNATQIKNCVLSTLELRISSWKKMKIIMGYILLFIQKMKESITIIRRQEQKCEEELLNVERIKEGEVMILKLAQENAFAADIAAIRKKSQIIDGQQDERLQNKNLQNLKPFVDEKGLVRVGGRLQNSSLEMECMHPIILQKNDTISTLIIRYCHDVVAHGGRGATMQEIRKTGYWIINCNALVRKVIHDCIMCRNMRSRFGEQIMADFPKDRVSESPPFTYCGLDIF